jgi:hypothetical protein
MDQDLAQVGVAALADAEQPRIVSDRVLLGHNPQPGRKSRPLRKAAPLSMAVATIGPRPGTYRPNFSLALRTIHTRTSGREADRSEQLYD